MTKAISNLKFKRVVEEASSILHRAGITDAPIDLNRVLTAAQVHVESVDLGPDISGLLAVHDGKATIAYSNSQSRQRQRFTIAHELGHFLLHKSDKEDTVFIDKDFIIKYRSNKAYSELEMRQEQEANTFAASLLMPKDLVFMELHKAESRQLSESDLIEKLAQNFDVSVPAMTFRLTNLNVLY